MFEHGYDGYGVDASCAASFARHGFPDALLAVLTCPTYFQKFYPLGFSWGKDCDFVDAGFAGFLL